MTVADREREKYTKTWNNDMYRVRSPGERVVLHYVSKCNPKHGRVIDFGAGCGRAAHQLHKLNFDVCMVDIAENCLDEEVRNEIGDRLVVGSLWDPLDLPRAPEGFCTDVMEHIPPEKVDDTLRNIMGLVDRCFFQIALFSHVFEGVEMHLTIESYTWWRDKLKGFGNVLDARDLGLTGWYYVEAN